MIQYSAIAFSLLLVTEYLQIDTKINDPIQCHSIFLTFSPIQIYKYGNFIGFKLVESS